MVELPGDLVPGEWLAAHLDEVRVVDVRWYLDGRSGLAAYRAGHIPGAIFLDVDTHLSAPNTRVDGRHPLPSPEFFADILTKAGIGAGQPVVAYDDTGGSTAARLWWMLRAIDEPVAVLDGGIAAWPGDLGTELPKRAPVWRTPKPWPAKFFVSANDVASGRAQLVDARTAARYADGDPAIDPRPGHIPGAVSRPWAGNLDETGRFLSPGQLRVRYADVADGPVVAYCGSGVTACHDLLALTIAGVDDIALYPGSFSQWGADETRPVERSSPAG